MNSPKTDEPNSPYSFFCFINFQPKPSEGSVLVTCKICKVIVRYNDPDSNMKYIPLSLHLDSKEHLNNWELYRLGK